jgi:hypothetical protein
VKHQNRRQQALGTSSRVRCTIRVLNCASRSPSQQRRRQALIHQRQTIAQGLSRIGLAMQLVSCTRQSSKGSWVSWAGMRQSLGRACPELRAPRKAGPACSAAAARLPARTLPGLLSRIRTVARCQ